MSTGYGGSPPASGIPATTVDAKGDLLVGTADDTVARKAVGTTGTTLVADSTASDGLAWSVARALIPVYPESGTFFAAPLLNSNTSIGADNTMYAHPFVVGRTITLSQLDVKVVTGGGASSVCRVGIYSDDGTMYPGALLLDAGTVATATTGTKSITSLTQQLVAGRVYWFAAAPQGAGGTAPLMDRGTLTSSQGGVVFGEPNANSGFIFANASGTWYCGFTQSGVSGALPSNFTTTRTGTVSIVRVAGKVA